MAPRCRRPQRRPALATSVFGLAVCFCLVLRTCRWGSPAFVRGSAWGGRPARRSTSARAGGSDAAVPSWSSLEKLLPSSCRKEPRIIDSVLEPKKPRLEGLVLYRERNGWCPYSERVWLALEAKGLKYETVLIDNMGSRPSWYGGTTPQIRWEDRGSQGESLDIVRQLDARYPESPALWPNEEVTELVNAFKRIFPRGTRPSSRAAFLFKGYAGQAVWRSEFEETLTKTDELLGKYSGGPFFYGASISAADCAWAPFLERYAAQLPCLHAGLDPRDPARWPRLAAWYEAMEKEVPAYASRVKGDAISWRRVLSQAGFGNAGVAPVLLDKSKPSRAATAELDEASAQRVWADFAGSRPHVAGTPGEEAAARIVRNRRAVVADAVRRGDVAEAEAELAFRECAALLAGGLDAAEPSAAAAAAAQYLDERLCVPRDMGELPGQAIRRLAAALNPASG